MDISPLASRVFNAANGVLFESIFLSLNHCPKDKAIQIPMSTGKAIEMIIINDQMKLVIPLEEKFIIILTTSYLRQLIVEDSVAKKFYKPITIVSHFCNNSCYKP